MAHTGLSLSSSSSLTSSTTFTYPSPPRIFLCSSYGIPSSSASSSSSSSSSSCFSSFSNRPIPHLLRSKRRSFGSLPSAFTVTIRTHKELHESNSAFICSALPEALFFDCDGVLVDTERDGHRVSFNQTFSEVSSVLIPRLYI